MTLKGVNSKQNHLQSERKHWKVGCQSRGTEETERRGNHLFPQVIIRVKTSHREPENWSRRNNRQFISILEDSEREDIENITTIILLN